MMQEEYLQLHFILYIQIERIPVLVQIYHRFMYLYFLIGEGGKSSHIFCLDNTGPGFNLGNLDYHQSVPKRHPNLVLKFAHLKDLNHVGPFNIGGVDGVKESEQRRVLRNHRKQQQDSQNMTGTTGTETLYPSQYLVRRK